MQGDFLSSIPAAPAAPDLIFFDLFSSKTDADQWTLSAFREIFAACRGRAVELFTYTCSTPVRAALLVAGFHVAKGRSTGEKVETTVALTPAAVHSSTPTSHELLGAQWLGRWSRSTAKFPTDLQADQRPAFIKTIDSFGDWVSQWRTWARNETNRRAHSSPATPAAPPLPSTTRSSL